ncbi:MAG: sulfotransferase family protein, partial [bacterium]
RFGLSIFDRRFLGLTSIDAIREEILESRRPLLAPGRTYVEKWPGNAFLIDELLSVFPDARFIHIIRDGRYVADSAFRRYGGEWLTGHLNVFTSLAMNQTGYDSTLPMMARGGLRWRLQVESAMESLAHLPAERSHTLRYEDLQREPEATVQAVFSFLDLDYEPHDVPRIESANRRPWDTWSEADKTSFKEVAGPLLERLGYATDRDW